MKILHGSCTSSGEESVPWIREVAVVYMMLYWRDKKAWLYVDSYFLEKYLHNLNI